MTDKKPLFESSLKHLLSVKQEDLKTKFGGTGIFLPSGELLVPDVGDANRLLLFADEDFFYIQEFQLPHKPYDIALGNDEKIYVTIVGGKMLKCEIDGDDLNILETIEVPSGTDYIDTHPDGFMVCTKAGFQVIDSEGKSKATFKKPSFSHPICVSAKQKRFYHRGENDGTLIGQKLSDGNEVFNCNQKFGSISNIQVDADDNVLAVSPGSCCIYQVSKDRRKHRTLIDKFEKITKPSCILYNSKKDLIVVYTSGNSFEVYKFE